MEKTLGNSKKKPLPQKMWGIMVSRNVSVPTLYGGQLNFHAGEVGWIDPDKRYVQAKLKDIKRYTDSKIGKIVPVTVTPDPSKKRRAK